MVILYDEPKIINMGWNLSLFHFSNNAFLLLLKYYIMN